MRKALKNPKKGVTLVGIFLISIIIIVVFNASSSEELGDLNSLGVDVKDASYSSLDYMEGFDLPEEDDPRLIELSIKVKELATLDGESLLKSVYGGSYINPANNTLFISVISDTSQVKEEIIKQLDPDRDITITFKKCDYTKAQLENAKDKIIEMDLNQESEKYVITAVAVLDQGKLLILLDKINTETVNALLESLPSSIPKDALVIRRGSLAKTAP